MKGHFTPHTEETKNKIRLSKLGKPSGRKGVKLSEETKRKISLSKKGTPNWNKGGVAVWAIGNKHSLGKIPWNKGKKVEKTSGENSSNWRGGITKNNRCSICNKKISWGANKCQDCFHKKNCNSNHYNWKGGITPEYRRLRINRISKNGGKHTKKGWEDLKSSFCNMCLCCKRCEPEIKLTKDHIIPILLGGTDDIENIQPLCNSCNSIKWIKVFDFKDNFNYEINNS